MKNWLKENWKNIWVYSLLTFITISLVAVLITIVLLCHQWQFMIPVGIVALMLTHIIHKWFDVIINKRGK